MSVWKLRASMVGTLALIIALSSLFFTAILLYLEAFDFVTLGIIIVAFNIGQWLVSPYIINALYRARELPANEQPKLHQMVADLSSKSGMSKPPKLMLAQIPVPNAFAYGSPIAGTRVAVTSGLLSTLNEGEVEAVIGHELGHLRHRDVQIMMVVSLLPAIAYYVGYSFWASSMYGRNRNEGGGGAAIGMAFIAFSWVLNLFTLYLSRLREYYADRHSASVVEGGPQKLSTGLAKIVNATSRMGRAQKQTRNHGAFRALFIADPDRASADAVELSRNIGAGDQKLVEGILSRRITTLDRVVEAMSTHPNIVKRLRALQELEQA